MTDPSAGPTEFDALFAQVTAASGGFGHRQHVQLTWLAVRRFGASAAAGLIGDGIRATAVRAGVPQKYHVTITRAWVQLVAFHIDETPTDTFDEFVAAHPALLDTQLLTHYYRPATLAGPDARIRWVEPDRVPLPHRTAEPGR